MGESPGFEFSWASYFRRLARLEVLKKLPAAHAGQKSVEHRTQKLRMMSCFAAFKWYESCSTCLTMQMKKLDGSLCLFSRGRPADYSSWTDLVCQVGCLCCAAMWLFGSCFSDFNIFAKILLCSHPLIFVCSFFTMGFWDFFQWLRAY